MATKYRLSFIVYTLIVAGCGRSDRPALAPASGIVKLDGIPVEGATVSFLPVEGGRPGSGLTDVEGRYTIKTFEDAPGGIVGEHKVAVMKVSGDGAFVQDGEDSAPVSGDVSGEDDGSDGLSQVGAPSLDGKSKEPEIVYDVPKKYINPEKSGLTVTVPAEGSDALNFELSR